MAPNLLACPRSVAEHLMAAHRLAGPAALVREMFDLDLVRFRDIDIECYSKVTVLNDTGSILRVKGRVTNTTTNKISTAIQRKLRQIFEDVNLSDYSGTRYPIVVRSFQERNTQTQLPELLLVVRSNGVLKIREDL